MERDRRIGTYSITFQVWRPSPTVNSDGCYHLVGENKFANISLIGNGGLVSETPEPFDIISTQPGDVVGFYAKSNKGNRDGIQLDDSFTGESVWFHRDTNSDPLEIRGDPAVCPFPVGTQSNRTLQTFTTAAPILSVDMSEWLINIPFNYYG